MDLLELQPEESEADFLQEDLAVDHETTTLPPRNKATDESQDLLDQVFGDSDISCSVPSFGDELSLLDPLTKTSDFPSTFPSKDAISAAASADQLDEGFDPFEDSEATIGSVESFGDGLPTSRDLRDRLKDRQNRKSGEFYYAHLCHRL